MTFFWLVGDEVTGWCSRNLVLIVHLGGDLSSCRRTQRYSDIYFLSRNQDAALKLHYWRRKWQPTPVFLPEKSHGRRRLVGYSPRSRKESDTTERLQEEDCFLTAPPLFLHPLTFLMSNCLNLHFGTLGRSGGWIKPISYKQETEDIKRICSQESPTGSCSVSV